MQGPDAHLRTAGSAAPILRGFAVGLRSSDWALRSPIWCGRRETSAFSRRQPWAKAAGASRIAFDYGANTIPFGAGIAEAEAAELIGRMRPRRAIVEGLDSASGWNQVLGSPGSHGTPISRVKIEVPIWPIFNAERP